VDRAREKWEVRFWNTGNRRNLPEEAECRTCKAGGSCSTKACPPPEGHIKKLQKNTHAADSGLNFSIFEDLILDSDVLILGLDLERE
jgi:hypothetical protein